MKLRRLLLGIAAVLALAAAASFAAFTFSRILFFTPEILTSSSPAGTYSVTLTGQSERPVLPAFKHRVWFRVVKDGKPYISDKYFHSGDWFDPSFSILYPQRAWHSENILHLYTEEFFRRGPAGVGVIRNTSDKTIKYLRVVSDDVYLIFDLDPGSVVRVSVPPPRGDVYLGAEGEFVDNVRIERR